MDESKYTKSVCDLFEKKFSIGWIDNLNWKNTDDDKKILAQGLGDISDFLNELLVNYGKLVLSGDHFIHDTKLLGKISNDFLSDFLSSDNTNTYKSKLTKEFVLLQDDIKDAENLVRYHCSNTKEKFEHKNGDLLLNAIPYGESRDSHDTHVDLLELICDVIWSEYIFSYDERYINKIYVQYLKFKKYSEEYNANTNISSVIKCAIEKVEFLLAKLSYFSKNKVIKFNYNFKLDTFTINNFDRYSNGDFRSYFLKYIDPERFDESEIIEWQKKSHEKDVQMWQMALLMRYYTKKTLSIQQIENLIEIEEKQYKDSIENDKNLVNEYSDKSFRNFMFNSRFSFLCQCDKTSTFECIKNELRKIEAIQNETFIFDYHPYQKAIEFTINFLDKRITEINKNTNLPSYIEFLKMCYEKFKKNIKWCKIHQPYYLQLRYDFSTLTKDSDLKVFYPSSFCRPLKYDILEEKLVQYNTKISFLEYHIDHIEEKYELMEAKEKIGSFEQKNMKYMGLFISVTTFLVGLLSIFIGNGNDVSILDKMQYVATLGIILLMFVCLGYVAVESKYSKIKPYFFGVVLSACVIYLTNISCNNSNNGSKLNHQKSQQDTTMIKDSTIVRRYYIKNR